MTFIWMILTFTRDQCAHALQHTEMKNYERIYIPLLSNQPRTYISEENPKCWPVFNYIPLICWLKYLLFGLNT